MTDSDSRRHPVFARTYAWLSRWMENEIADCRRQLLTGLTGRVVEVGAGNGMNFAHYPAAVTKVVAVEPEPHLRRLAERAAREASVETQVIEGVADHLPVGDAGFDSAVLSLVLCSVPDVPAALAEVRRVLRPGGELRFFEHVRADTAGLGRVQRLLDATVWPLAAGGCHTSRDTAEAIQRAGFQIEWMQRMRLPAWRIQLPVSPCILGMAARP